MNFLVIPAEIFQKQIGMLVRAQIDNTHLSSMETCSLNFVQLELAANYDRPNDK